MERKLTPPEGWICSDPDTHQYYRKISAETYDFREMLSVTLWNYATCTSEVMWEATHLWRIGYVDISEYSRRELDEMMSCYYDNADIRAELLRDSPEVVAEIIFELEMYEGG